MYKMLETIFLKTLTEEIVDTNAIPPEQFGFRKGYNTEMLANNGNQIY